MNGSLPDPLNIANLVAAYDNYLRQQRRDGDGKDDYGLLSEHSHPNAACFQHCNEYIGAKVRFKAASSPSPLPVVNWCLIDLLMFFDSLLLLSNEKTVQTQLGKVLQEVAQLAPIRRGS